MGCVSSKQGVSVTPASLDYSGGFNVGSGRCRVETYTGATGGLVAELEINLNKVKKRGSYQSGSEPSDSGRESSNGGGSESVSFRLGNMHKFLEREQVAAGWPVWLSAVAGEAIHGWVPLRADSFEKLEKIGQGTYSTVFRALDLETQQIVALKKVRFDNFEPESVRFMAREISILRRLDHPNIIKLLGLIASRSSCNIYLVFEYMEHDISGLLSSPEITFTEPQVKCYMKQLLSGLDHCHSRGVIHRDIKGANLLVDNNGVLKVADFGLANYQPTRPHRHPLTSRVVTLWYRPPELLLGSTDYSVTVDLWSAGCLLAELLMGKPILQGRTEVEQLHKIFKLCGSPPEEYWRKTRFPHATLFRPNQPYRSTLWETFKDHSEVAVKLIETLLSVEPHKRGTAASALSSEYFRRMPYACDPSAIPSYPPSKEINIKNYEEASRKKQGGRIHAPESRKATKKQNGISKLAPEESLRRQMRKTGAENGQTDHEIPKQLVIRDRAALSQGEHDIHSGPLQPSTASINNFAWAMRRPLELSSSSINRNSSRSLNIESSSVIMPPHLNNLDPDQAFERTKLSMLEQWRQLEQPDLNVEFSGPLVPHSRGMDELLEKHERHIRRAVRRSWFRKG